MMSMSGLVLGGGQGGNVPLQIAGGPAAYYDASVPTTISIDTGVDQWTDLSGNGNHVVQATTGLQPSYTAGGVEFDGVDDVLIAPAATSMENLWSGGGYCLFVVRPDSDGEADQGRIFDIDGTTDFFCESEAGGFIRFRMTVTFSGTNAGFRSTVSIPVGATSINEVSYDADNVANVPSWRFNGAVLANSVVTTPTGAVTSDAGNALNIGNNVISSRTLDGGLFAFAMYTSIPTATEQTALRQFFSRKFGIAIS